MPEQDSLSSLPSEGQPASPTPVETPPLNAPTQDSGAGRPSIDQEITLSDGTTLPLHEILRRAEAADGLAAYKEHAGALLRGQEDPVAREASVRHVMSEEGYTPEQIEDYVMQLREESNQPTGGSQGMEPGMEAPTPSGVFGENDFQSPQPSYDDLRRRVDEMEGRQNQTNVEQMRVRLDQEVSKTLDGHHGLRILLEKSQVLNGEGDEARKYIAEELERQTMDFLRVRKARGEAFNPGWFAEESAKAAEAVFKKYRSVIGDPDKLQRAPETESGQESLLRKPPLPPPTYERGDGRAGADEKAHDYTVDVLSRLAMGLEGGGDSKV